LGYVSQAHNWSQIVDDVKAGLAGINAGILLPAKVPGIQLTIFEKNEDVVSLINIDLIDLH
jgi:hypothetical protein